MDEETRASLMKSLIIGTPADVAKKIQPFKGVLGEDVHFVARSSYPGVPFEKTRRSIELLGEVKKLL
jgi:alkanesulfonate monooxygenase SsuD/methylene tetrahydromethanopterin reductase-like flavin-dependent oxidoreductase (luciferase family)